MNRLIESSSSILFFRPLRSSRGLAGGRWSGRVGSHQNIEEMNSINNFQYSSNAITSSIELSNLFEKKKNMTDAAAVRGNEGGGWVNLLDRYTKTCQHLHVSTAVSFFFWFIRVASVEYRAIAEVFNDIRRRRHCPSSSSSSSSSMTAAVWHQKRQQQQQQEMKQVVDPVPSAESLEHCD